MVPFFCAFVVSLRGETLLPFVPIRENSWFPFFRVFVVSIRGLCVLRGETLLPFVPIRENSWFPFFMSLCLRGKKTLCPELARLLSASGGLA